MNGPLNHDTANAKMDLTADFSECFFHLFQSFFASFKFDFIELSINSSGIAVKAQKITDAKIIEKTKVIIELFKLFTTDFPGTI